MNRVPYCLPDKVIPALVLTALGLTCMLALPVLSISYGRPLQTETTGFQFQFLL